MDQPTLPVMAPNAADTQRLEGWVEALRSESVAHSGGSKWQGQQAREALELDYAKVCGIPLEPRDAVT